MISLISKAFDRRKQGQSIRALAFNKFFPISPIPKLYKNIRTEKDFLKRHDYINPISSLDLGCGSNISNPFNATDLFGIDIRNDLDKNIYSADLITQSLPFPDQSFDMVTAFNLLEHIPRIYSQQNKTIYPVIKLFNEIHRVLKENGYFYHVTPMYPSIGAFQDPTHVNVMTENTIPQYFCEPLPYASHLGYGFEGLFRLIEQRWCYNQWIIGLIQKTK